jgi:hypothetical protein
MIMFLFRALGGLGDEGRHCPKMKELIIVNISASVPRINIKTA